MPRPLFDSPYIFGLHDPGGENLMAQANRRGWIVFTVEVGSDPGNQSGFDFSPWANQDFGIICRINNGYGSAGTIPYSSQYANFARRVASFVAASSGCKIWVIGNEMNHSQEWPAVPSASAAATPGVTPSATPAATPRLQPARGRDTDPTGHGSSTRFSALHPTPAAASNAAAAASASFEPITPSLYATCFRQCRNAIKLTPGHGDDQVAIGAVAPWNNQVTYPTNPTGDWIRYFADILALLGDGGLDAITLHTYTHGSDPALVTDTSTMNAPFENRYFNFQAYRNFMDAVPPAMRSLPAYITETDQDVPWLDQNNGWVRAAYAEMDRWNQQGNAQQIRALVLYRWPPYDKWYIQGKQGVINDFTEAMRNDYRWKAPPPKPADFAAGDTVRTLDIVNFRQTPGGAVLAQLPLGSELKVVSSRYTLQNGLIWWNLRRTVDGGGTQDGWVAQVSPDGIVLLEKVIASLPSGSFKPGDQIQTQTVVRMRKTPGTTNKPADDVVADVPQGTVLTVLSGPTTADGMTWWRNQGRMPNGTQVIGWQAEKLPDGTVLLAPYVAAPVPPSIELPPATFRPEDRFATTTIVNLRRSAGSSNKPANDVVASIPQGSEGTIVSGPVQRDGMTWWEVRMAGGQSLQGWMAEALPSGEKLMQRLAAAAGTFAKGDLAVTSDYANVRRTPGITGKPGDDVLGMFAPRTVVNVAAGPESKDNLTWWRVGGIGSNGVELIGYVAERTPDGAQLLIPAPKLPNTSIPDKTGGIYLAAPYDGSYSIAQLWGENPSFYSKFNYDGVALRGHNGIDFLTPGGTQLYATDGGEVAQVGFEDGGFGNYILIRHPWGESIYAHLASTAVIPGQAVGRGQYIGGSDNTGGSSGPHLHFAIRVNPYQRTDGWGGFTDPLPYLPPNSFVLPPYVLDPASLAIAAALPAPTNVRDARQAPSSMGSVAGTKRP
jgi:murein DD-endopeptidase MepM/ murein hydrolase activator NlpD